MVQCYVQHCKNRSDTQNWKKLSSISINRKITFHSIPKNNTSRNLWIDILGLSSPIPNSARICSDHFLKEFFDEKNGLTRLRPNALPFKVQSEEVEEEEKKIPLHAYNHQQQIKK